MSFTGWHRASGSGYRWKPVANEEDWCATWDRLLQLVDALGSGEMIVLRTGIHPGTKEEARRGEERLPPRGGGEVLRVS